MGARVASDPRTQHVTSLVKEQTAQLSAQGHHELKKRLNEAAGGLKGLAEQMTKDEKENVEKKVIVVEQQPSRKEKELKVTPKMSIALPQTKKPVVEPSKTTQLVTREPYESGRRHETPEHELVVQPATTNATNEISERSKPIFEEKGDPMALLREKTARLASVTKTASIRYGSSVAERLESRLERPR